MSRNVRERPALRKEQAEAFFDAFGEYFSHAAGAKKISAVGPLKSGENPDSIPDIDGLAASRRANIAHISFMLDDHDWRQKADQGVMMP